MALHIIIQMDQLIQVHFSLNKQLSVYWGFRKNVKNNIIHFDFEALNIFKRKKYVGLLTGRKKKNVHSL